MIEFIVTIVVYGIVILILTIIGLTFVFGFAVMVKLFKEWIKCRKNKSRRYHN